jgi:hypothetical protein
MGRAYAGILGPLAFGLVIARSLLGGWGVETTLLAASGSMFAMALVGYAVGELGDLFVRESVRSQFQTAMAEWNAKQQQPAKKK